MLLHDPAEMLFLTPKLVETAQQAGVLAINGSKEQFEGLYDLVGLAIPESMPPHAGKDNLIFVARYGGFLGVGRDIDFAHVPPDEPFLQASAYDISSLDNSFTPENGWTTKRQLELEDEQGKTLLHLTLSSWKRPYFGWGTAVALTPKPADGGQLIRSAPGMGMTMTDVRRVIRSEAAYKFPNPFSAERRK